MNRALSTLVRGKGNKDTVIAVLGFAGSKESYTQKYAEIYQNKGYDTIQFTAQVPTSYNIQLKNTREVSSAAEHIKEVLHDKEIAFHTFSMNGIFTLCSLQLQYPELQILSKTRGIFCDSAPSDLGFAVMIVMNQINSPILKSGKTREILKYRSRRIKELFRLVQHYTELPIRRSLGMTVDDISAFDFLKNHPDMPPTLAFAYSAVDPICDYRSIANFAAHHRHQGRQVEELFLQDSPHVDHYRKYPKEYMETVDRFLDNLKPRNK